MLELINVSIKIGGKTLFTDMSFTADSGETICITGDSGVGKTTLLRAMLGFQPIADGNICVDGEPITAESAEEFRKNMAYVPQELSLPTENVKDMVKLPFTLKVNKGCKYSKAILMSEWAKLGLSEDLYEKKVSQVSGGQRQRIMIAVSGMLGKKIMLVDEPTSALDENSAMMVMRYFKGLAAKGCIVIVVTHDNVFAKEADKIVNII